MAGEPDKPSIEFRFSLPVALVVLGILLIGASFLPIGDLVARSQWTSEDSTAFDRISKEYKRATYDARAQSAVTEQEWEAQREKMRARMQAFEDKLARAKSQPRLWSRYLLGIGVLMTAAGFYMSTNPKS